MAFPRHGKCLSIDGYSPAGELGWRARLESSAGEPDLESSV